MIISYCVNPTCPNPKNHPKLKKCYACGSSLILNKRYRVIKTLGKGGFGATFVGVDLTLVGNPLCVVKQLRPATDDPQAFKMALSLFRREAKTLDKINHPQIPKLMNYFVHENEFYLIQELINGQNLQREIKQGGVYGELAVKRFLVEMTPVIQYIHSQKVIHRDLKPANILRQKKDAKLILIDFGAVKDQVNTQLAQTYGQTALTKFAVGTMGYAPPEQMAMRPIFASDIYALGATCLYLLTGKSPKNFDRDPDSGALIWQNEVTISPGLKKILTKMLEPDVRERFKTADELWGALDVTSFEQGMNVNVPAKGFIEVDGDDFTMSDGSGMTSSSSATEQLRQAITNRRSQNAVKNSKRNVTIKWDQDTFTSAYQSGKKDFSDQHLDNLNFSGLKLGRFVFRNAQLEGIVCVESNLSQANFYNASLEGADFSQANLFQTYLAKANLEGADFRGANLGSADLTNANLKDANFCGANLKNAKVNQSQLKDAKVNWGTTFPDGNRRWWKIF